MPQLIVTLKVPQSMRRSRAPVRVGSRRGEKAKDQSPASAPIEEEKDAMTRLEQNMVGGDNQSIGWFKTKNWKAAVEYHKRTSGVMGPDEELTFHIVNFQTGSEGERVLNTYLENVALTTLRREQPTESEGPATYVSLLEEEVCNTKLVIEALTGQMNDREQELEEVRRDIRMARLEVELAEADAKRDDVLAEMEELRSENKIDSKRSREEEDAQERFRGSQASAKTH